MEGEPPILTNYISALMVALAISLLIEGVAPFTVLEVGDYPMEREIALLISSIAIFILSLALYRGYKVAYIITPIMLITTMVWGLANSVFDTDTDLYVRSSICIVCTVLLLVPRSMRSYFLGDRKATA